jgi:hypothetical protein
MIQITNSKCFILIIKDIFMRNSVETTIDLPRYFS